MNRTVNLEEDVLVTDDTTKPVVPVETFKSATAMSLLKANRDVDVRISTDGATTPRVTRDVVVIVGVGDGGCTAIRSVLLGPLDAGLDADALDRIVRVPAAAVPA